MKGAIGHFWSQTARIAASTSEFLGMIFDDREVALWEESPHSRSDWTGTYPSLDGVKLLYIHEPWTVDRWMVQDLLCREDNKTRVLLSTDSQATRDSFAVLGSARIAMSRQLPVQHVWPGYSVFEYKLQERL